MSGLKKLAQETAIYGVSSIAGRFLNWCLVPLYSYVLTDSGEYGIVTNLYAWTALLMILLTYGMETGFFRFINKQSENSEIDRNRVYTTTMICVGSTSILFALFSFFGAQPIATAMGYELHPEYIAMLGPIVALDAFSSIPFSYLRYKNKAFSFAGIKLLMILTNIGFNIFFLVGCPSLHLKYPELINWFYVPSFGVGYIFVANVISTIIAFLCLLPHMQIGKWQFSGDLLKRMLRYSLPLLLLGIAGIMNQTVDKIIFPMVYPDKTEAMQQLGIYGASFKIAMIMMMFTYAFRFAYEPFVFSTFKEKDSKESYAEAMKYYFITALLIFLLMVFYLDIFQFVLGPEYRVGLKVIPIVLLTYLIQGIVDNLSLCYQLTDKTSWGAILSVIGLAITLPLYLIYVPLYSYWASASASLVCFLVRMLLSYFVGQKYYPIRYPLKRMGLYLLLAIVLCSIAYFVTTNNIWINLSVRSVLLLIYIYFTIKNDLPISEIPVLKKIYKKGKVK